MGSNVNTEVIFTVQHTKENFTFMVYFLWTQIDSDFVYNLKHKNNNYIF